MSHKNHFKGSYTKSFLQVSADIRPVTKTAKAVSWAIVLVWAIGLLPLLLTEENKLPFDIDIESWRTKGIAIAIFVTVMAAVTIPRFTEWTNLSSTNSEATKFYFEKRDTLIILPINFEGYIISLFGVVFGFASIMAILIGLLQPEPDPSPGLIILAILTALYIYLLKYKTDRESHD